MSSLCILGTDTNVGKTIVCGLLAAAFNKELGLHTQTQKWIQTGQAYEDILTHDQIIQKIYQNYIPYQKTIRCPYNFKLAASPHLASKIENKCINPKYIYETHTKLKKMCSCVLVEGSGGILSPINENMVWIDLLLKNPIPIILTIWNKLGSITSTLSNVMTLHEKNISILGLIYINDKHTSPMILKDNIKTIKKFTKLTTLSSLPESKNLSKLYFHIKDTPKHPIIKTWIKKNGLTTKGC